jgi:hypothetical protein
LPLVDLQTAVQAHLGESPVKKITLFSEKCAWQGAAWRLQLNVQASSDDEGSVLGLYSQLMSELSSTVVRRASRTCSILKPMPQQQQQQRIRQGQAAASAVRQGDTEFEIASGSNNYSLKCNGWGKRTCVGTFKTWQQLRDALQQKGFIYPDGCIRLRLRIASSV